MHILHLEDSELDADWIEILLRKQWPDCLVTNLSSRGDFEAKVRQGDFDLILSDYSLPAYDGLHALQFARACQPEKPFIYLSGTIGEEKAIEALKSGAVDYVVKDRPARLISAIQSALDVAEQTKARRAAERKVREQASLLDKSREAICVTNLEGLVTYWNASAERLFGWSSEEAKGRSLREMLYASDQARYDGARAAAVAKGEWRGELGPQTRQREDILVDSFWSLVRDENDAPQSILMIDADITEKRKLESHLLQSQRLETLGLLVGGIAHDLNNMLAPIITAVDLLHVRPEAATDGELLRILDSSAHHVADLVAQLLDFARGGGGQRGEVAVDDLISSVRRLLRGTLPSNVEIRTSLGSDLWPVRADATQLRQVLLNLCINARDAMPVGGRIEILAEDVRVDGKVSCAEGEAKPGPYVRLSVSDTGTGIPEGLVERIFTPFFSTKQVGKGSGLGLANVAGIVKAHGGFLKVETRMGVGTTFHVYLPAVAEAAAAPGGKSAARKSVDGQDEHILVIEDDDNIRRVLEIILTTRGYSVTMAAGGEEGLKQVRQNPGKFSLVMTDWHLPGVGGLEVIRALRALPVVPKIIVLSGAPKELQVQSPELAEVEYLCKPLTVQSLLGALRRVLEPGELAPA